MKFLDLWHKDLLNSNTAFEQKVLSIFIFQPDIELFDT